MGWLESLALAALLAGLTGGVHCAAMCGGIVCLLNGGERGAAPRWRHALAYNAGRILSYTLAGALAGAAGQAGLLFRGWLPLQQVFMVAAGLTLVLMALYLAGVSPLMGGLEAAGGVLWRHVKPLAQRMIPVDSMPKALGLGMAWGWLPCGMVYAVLLLAMSTGHFAQGALVMLAFGLGTLPNLLLMSGLANRLRRVLVMRGARLAVAGAMGIAGLYGVAHATHADIQPVAGFFCRVAPQWFGQ
jgi:uncharacterized protein